MSGVPGVAVGGTLLSPRPGVGGGAGRELPVPLTAAPRIRCALLKQEVTSSQ